jgi:hypothetical protein
MWVGIVTSQSLPNSVVACIRGPSALEYAGRWSDNGRGPPMREALTRRGRGCGGACCLCPSTPS